MHRRPGHLRRRRAHKAAITPMVVCDIRPGVPCLIRPALHAYAAVGFPEDRGAQHLATDNAPPVPCEANTMGYERNTQPVTMSLIGEQRMLSLELVLRAENFFLL